LVQGPEEPNYNPEPLPSNAGTMETNIAETLVSDTERIHMQATLYTDSSKTPCRYVFLIGTPDAKRLKATRSTFG
jgi:hypothetical protein